MPSRRTRVAIVTEVFLPKVDGIVNTVLRIVDGLSSRGAEILLLTPGGYRNAYLGVRIVQTRSVPCPIYPGLRLGWPDSRLVRALLEFEPDAIHLAGPTVLGARLAPIAAAIAPTVSTYHTSLAAYAHHYRVGAIAGPVWGWLRRAHNACGATLCPSRATRDDLVGHGFDRVKIWSRGVDALRFDPARRSAAARADLGSRTDGPLLLSVGRVASEKRLDTLGAVARECPDVDVAIVGDGPDRARLRRAIGGPRVRLVGERHGRALADAYASADAFLFPSDTDTFGNVILEAMASGLPVVAAAAGGALDLVDHGRTGLLVQPGDQAAFAAATRLLVGDPDLRARLGAAGRAFALTQTWDRRIDELLGHYQAAGADVEPALSSRV